MLKIVTLFLLISIYNSLSGSVLDKMTLEEKVGQLLIVHFQGETANHEASVLIEDIKVGGIIYYNWSNGLYSKKQVHDLSIGLQKLAKTNPLALQLFIGIDQEGGVVSRLNNGFTLFPGNLAVAETKKPSLAKKAAYITGKELAAVGINVNFAPVVDINSNPLNPVIGIRSFSHDPKVVTKFGKSALSGYKKAGIITTLKHFPGHGDTKTDSHEDLPLVSKSLQELKKIELVPFKKLANSSDMIMTGHLLVPAFDKENCSTLSKKTLDYLKEKIGFKGLIISDSLVMQGVLKKCETIEEASIQAFNAGCDLLLLGGRQLIDNHLLELTTEDISKIHLALVNAVKTGKILESRLNEALQKIVTLKEKHFNSSEAFFPEKISKQKKCDKLGEKIATLALKVSETNEWNLYLAKKNIGIIYPALLKNELLKTRFKEMGKKVDFSSFDTLSPSKSEIKKANNLSKTSDVLIIFSYNAWKNREQMKLLHSLLETKKIPVILIVTRDPEDVDFFSKSDLIIQTFSPTLPSLKAACYYLEEHL